MGKLLRPVYEISKIAVGCALFGLGFNLFLLPNGLNAGGLSGLAMIIVRLFDFGSIGLITAIMNLPLFALAGLKIGKKFFVGSLLGMMLNALFLDVFARMPVPTTEPLIGALYGGVTCGAGLGIVFASGASTGGSDIIVRLLKMRYSNMPIGSIAIAFDVCIAALSAVVFQDFSVALYSCIAIFLSGQIVDAVVYRFDYSKIVWIITKHHERIAEEIDRQLNRGATFLRGEGSFSRQELKVVLTAVKRQQLADLKSLVVGIDPEAFIIVQQAHQVLGDGFSRYSKDML